MLTVKPGQPGCHQNSPKKKAWSFAYVNKSDGRNTFIRLILQFLFKAVSDPAERLRHNPKVRSQVIIGKHLQ